MGVDTTIVNINSDVSESTSEHLPEYTPPENAPLLLNPPGYNAKSVQCRVCHHPVPVPSNLTVVKCPLCKEGTQIGPPPRGKSYVVCECKALLTVSTTATDSRCPRPHCRKYLIMKPPASGKRRAMCAHCDTLLTYKWTAAAIICPKCKGRSIVSRHKMIIYPLFSFIIGLIALIVGILGVAISIFGQGNVVWGAYSCIIIGPCCLIRALIYVRYNCSAPSAHLVDG